MGNTNAPPIDPVDLLLKEGTKLPSFPDVLLKLDAELQEEEADLPKVSRLVGMDPVLSGQILRLAHSSWYSRGGSSVNDLSRALIRLGLPTTRQLVHALVLPSLFAKKEGAFDLKAYWKHSFGVALFAQGIGRRIGLDRAGMETLWTAGLLHDIGALILDMLARDTYRKLMRIGDQESVVEGEEPPSIDFVSLEREWLGTDHAQLGSVFLERNWKLPREIVWCVRYSHDPSWVIREPDAIRTILPIHVADLLCEAHGASWLPRNARREFPQDSTWSLMGLTDADAKVLIAEVDRSLEQSEALLMSA